jgi:hypothetical protein
MKHPARWLATGALGAIASACSTDPLSLDAPSFSSAQLAAAFTTVPLEFASVTSSFGGDSDGVTSLWLPGPRMQGFGGGLMGGGLGDAYAGAMGPGRGFGHHGPFGGRFGGGLTCTGAFNASSGRFVCDPITRNGVTVTQSIAYASAAGAVQQAFDTITTDRVNVTTSAAGTVTFDRDSSKVRGGPGHGHGPRHIGHFAGDTSTILTATTTVNNASDRTVTGLASGSTSRTINGTSGGTESTTGTSSAGAFTAKRTAADTTRGLVVPIVSGRGTYPTAGTVIRVMQATLTYTGAAPVSTSRREVITYDGSATATVVITRDGTTQTCTMPLPRGRLTCS